MPRTEAGKRLLAAMGRIPPDGKKGLTWFIDAIEAEAREEEAERWRRLPGTYRDERGIVVVVDVPESASWVAYEFPDEVEAIISAERARIRAAVEGLPILGYEVDVRDVLRIIDGGDA